MHKPEHCWEGDFRQLSVACVMVSESSGWRFPGGSAWLCHCCSIGKGDRNESGLAPEPLSLQNYCCNNYIITCDQHWFQFKQMRQCPVAVSDLLWRANLWQRVRQDLLSVLSMNPSTCPRGNCVYDSSLKARIFIYCPISLSGLRWAQGRCQAFAHQGSRAAAHRCSLSVSHLPKRHAGTRSLPSCLHTDASVVLL